MLLKGRKILLGITGSIAAYKSALLIRELVKQGAEVRVIATASALSFITPVTLATLSGNKVYSELTNPATGEWHNHVELGIWADLFLVAPASANTIAKMANGLCDNLLLATYLSARCPVVLAPAMDLDMYRHPSFLSNLSRLISYGNKIIEAGTGELASGLRGQGRMEEPAAIAAYVISFFATGNVLSGKKALVTAGPTYEALDPVRFIGNHSSGKMGYAIAESLAARGAAVTLVSGPTFLKTEHPLIEVKHVTSAREMFEASEAVFNGKDIAVFSAAVADYTPETRETEKIKKKEDTFTIKLVKTKDIAGELSGKKRPGQITVGFALETSDELNNAGNKLKSKNLDFIVLNSMKDEGAGFRTDTNKVTIVDRKGDIVAFNLKTKKEVAEDIVNKIQEYLK